MKILGMTLAGLLLTGNLAAQDTERQLVLTQPDIHGTIRSKYEYQYENDEHRFQVRNARVGITGALTPIINYKAEIDLSDEGVMKMLDAYVRVKPLHELNLTVGQMRVPFSIDAHRSPHKRLFANRSFLAKQVGNVRDVGLAFRYSPSDNFPLILEAGLFNGTGITAQKGWHSMYSYSSKLQFVPTRYYNLTLSMMKTRPAGCSMYMYDVGTYVKLGGLHLEVEGLYKHYEDKAFDPVWTFNGFFNYDYELGDKGLIKRVSFLGRFDYMQNHWRGKTDMPEIDDAERKRLTGGVTLGFGKLEQADLRINYEKYFYKEGAVVDPSERDKIVVEMMFHF